MSNDRLRIASPAAFAADAVPGVQGASNAAATAVAPATHGGADSKPIDAAPFRVVKTGQTGTQTATLLSLVHGAEVFHTPEREAFVALQLENRHEVYRVRSREFRLRLVGLYFADEGKPPSENALAGAVGTLEAMALFQGRQRQVHIRVGADRLGQMCLDLANRDGEIVEVTGSGWRVVRKSEVLFHRPKGMRPLPRPQAGGDLELLRELLNVPTDDDGPWQLIVAWLLGALNPRGPYPVLCLNGPPGAAKSFAGSTLRALVDPSTAMLRSAPREERDLAIAANSNWVVALDNISSLQQWLSDALCRMATGEGFATRQLYTDVDETIINVSRPMLLTGIEDFVVQEDLLDRALVVQLAAIPRGMRRPEAWLKGKFKHSHGLILGALLDLVSVALKNLPSTRLSELPRLADFAYWVTAAEPILGWAPGTFVAAMNGNREAGSSVALENSPLTPELIGLLAEQDPWQGSASDLLDAIERRANEKVRSQRNWPRSPSALSGQLRRLANCLGDAGIRVVFPNRSSKKRLIRLEQTPELPSLPSPPSPVLQLEAEAPTRAGEGDDE